MQSAARHADRFRTSGAARSELRIGTSGWHYKDWFGPFFPADLRKNEALAFYSGLFDTAELNLPFYRTPTVDAVQGWYEQTPPDFRFTWKASKFITHWKRLTERSRNSLELLEERISYLREKAGPILFQLPPNMKSNLARLESFIALLPKKRQYTFEFRHPSWYGDEVFELLARYDIALCLSDHADAPAPCERTASFVYIRGHGPSGRYHGSYSDEVLATWARKIRRWRGEGHAVWCFFDNDVKSAAPMDAQRLKKMLRR